MSYLTQGSGGQYTGYTSHVDPNTGQTITQGTGSTTATAGYSGNGTAVTDSAGNVIGYQGGTPTHAYLTQTSSGANVVQHSPSPVNLQFTTTGSYVYDGAGNYLGGTGAGSPSNVAAAGGPPTSGAGSPGGPTSGPTSGGIMTGYWAVVAQLWAQYWYLFLIAGGALFLLLVALA